LHLLLENPESLIHIVFANEYLQMFSDLVVAVAPCARSPGLIERGKAGDMNEPVLLYKNFIAR